MLFIRNISILLISAVFNFSDKPAKNAEIFLVNRSGEVVAFQKTGEKGKATFQYIEDGNYSIAVVFPQQEGKYLKEKRKHQTLAKASYNQKNKTYYYQGREGFFAIKFSGMKRLNSDTFEAIFRERKEEENLKIEIARFQARKSGAQISLQVKALKAKQFKKYTDKAKNDLSLFSIPGIK